MMGVLLDTYAAPPSSVQAALVAWNDLALAVSRAQQAIAFPQSVGYPRGPTAFLDVESCVLAVPAAAWISAWAQTVSRYFLGLYVRAPEPLSDLQLYALLTGMLQYGRSESTVSMVAQRRYQILQEQGNVLLQGVLIEMDRIQMDALGGMSHGMILPKPSALPARTPQPSPLHMATRRSLASNRKWPQAARTSRNSKRSSRESNRNAWCERRVPLPPRRSSGSMIGKAPLLQGGSPWL